MKILLIEPPKKTWELMGNCVSPPLGLAQLASVLIGIESSTDGELNDFHKKLRIDEVIEAVKLLKRNGIVSQGLILIGTRQDWGYFVLGIGCILIIEIIIRQPKPEYRKPIFGKLILALVLIAVGAGNIYDLRQWWPLIFVAIGIAIILYGLQRTQRPR